MGKRERDRIVAIQHLPPVLDPPRPRPELDEIERERGVVLISERGGMSVLATAEATSHWVPQTCQGLGLESNFTR